MAYTAVVTREIGDTVQGYEWAAVDSDGKIVEEIWDGGLGSPYIATQIKICERSSSDSWYPSTHIDKISIEVYVTDSRVIIRCDKYDKGDSRWIGGLSALAMNAIERGIGAVRSRGKSFIGHLRYEWLESIYYSQKTGWLSDNTIRLFYTDDDRTEQYIELILKKDTDMAEMSNKIFHKALAYRKAMTDKKSDEFQSFLNEYSDCNKMLPVSTDSKKMSGIIFPYAYLAPIGFKYRPGDFSQEAGAICDSSLQISADEDPNTMPLYESKCVLVKRSTGEEIVVMGDSFTLGRSLKRSDYIINDPAVSNVHAQIIKSDGCFYIKDMKSSNHTYVNGVITENDKKQLRDGDVVKLAETEFIVSLRQE